MQSLFLRVSVAILSFLAAAACSGNGSMQEVPETVRGMENVTIYSSSDVSEADTLYLIQEEVFGSDEDVFIRSIGNFTVDENGKVFLVDGVFGNKTVRMYASDGKHIKKLGEPGQGPGDFSGPCCLQIKDGLLHVYDGGVSRLTQYDAENGELLSIKAIDFDLMEGGGQVKGMRFTGYHFINDEELLLSFWLPQKYFDTEPGTIYLYSADSDWNKLESEVAVMDQIIESWGDWQGRRIMKFYPFFPKPLYTVTSSGRIFIARSDEFLIEEISKDGRVVGGFYYPTEKMPVIRDHAIESSNVMEKNIASNLELPENWPVIQSMFADDQDNLWISIFTDVDDVIEWRVLEPDGRIIARFNRPGDRFAYPLPTAGLHKVIRNGAFYERETNPETGLQQVVRYRINFGGSQ